MASQLEGVAELTATLNELGVKIAARELKGTVKAAMQEVEHKARASIPQGRVPHKTYSKRLVPPGFALSTLHIEVSLNKQTGAVVARLGVGREAFYVVQFIELGTYKYPKQPWLIPAFESSEDAMLQTIASELRSRIGKIQQKSMARAGQRSSKRGRVQRGG